MDAISLEVEETQDLCEGKMADLCGRDRVYRVEPHNTFHGLSGRMRLAEALISIGPLYFCSPDRTLGMDPLLYGAQYQLQHTNTS